MFIKADLPVLLYWSVILMPSSEETGMIFLDELVGASVFVTSLTKNIFYNNNCVY